MASLELDHTFIKAIHLLHSKSKDSTDVIKQMLDDAIAQKLGLKESKSLTKQEHTISFRKSSPKLFVSETGNNEAKSLKIDESVKKYEVDLETVLLPSDYKRAKLDSSPRVSPGQSPLPLHAADNNSSPNDSSEGKKLDDVELRDDGNTDADEFALEMGLVCIVCRQIDVAPGNQLIECQECHSLYHQECHRPPATDHDVNDPRLVWYCAKCKKNMKKVVASPKPAKLPLKPSSLSVSKELPSNKSDTFSSLQLPFKRVEQKSTSGTSGLLSSSGSNKPIGLAGFAANFNNKNSLVASGGTMTTAKSSSSLKSTSSSKSSIASLSSANQPKGLASLASMSKQTSSVSKSVASSLASLPVTASSSASASSKMPAVTSSTSLMSADKRLQNMKKKAAKMQQEKRRLK